MRTLRYMVNKDRCAIIILVVTHVDSFEIHMEKL